jgi:hypothetical protein
MQKFALSEEAKAFIKEHSENCPDVESGDETAEDVADTLRGLFQAHAEAAVAASVLAPIPTAELIANQKARDAARLAVGELADRGIFTDSFAHALVATTIRLIYEGKTHADIESLYAGLDDGKTELDQVDR